MAEAEFPILLASNVLELLPAPLLARATAVLMRRLCRAHPRLFQDLADHPPCAIGIVLTDLPLRFVLRFGGRPPSLQPARELPGHVDACVKGRLAALLALVEGRLDGDALFFSREIVITGDAAAVLTLRNILDRDAVDVFAAAAALSGPLDRLVRSAALALEQRLRAVRRRFVAIHADLHAASREACPLAASGDRLEAEMRDLSARLTRLETRGRQRNLSPGPAGSVT